LAHLKYKPHLVIINDSLKLSRKWSSGKNLELRNLFPLKVYIVVNFRSHRINQDVRKLIRILTLIIKKNILITVWSSKYTAANLASHLWNIRSKEVEPPTFNSPLCMTSLTGKVWNQIYIFVVFFHQAWNFELQIILVHKKWDT